MPTHISVSKLPALLFAVAGSSACADDADVTKAFVGTWAYEAGTFRIDCDGHIMELAADSSLSETIEIGSASDLVKSDSGGCVGITFDVQGSHATLSPAPQSCTIPNMGTSTATSYTITISADRTRLTTASLGTFQPIGAPGACMFTGGGTLSLVSE